jgi:ABC-type uncharacterized transport system involved in gliding motility auxiliary subunit
MIKKDTQIGKNLDLILWTATGILSVGLLLARAIYPEYLGLTLLIGIPLLAVLGKLVQQNHQALRSRTAAYGLNSAVTVVLVLGILGVLNFLASRYPYKLDLTKNKVHTLSDQTVKLLTSLQKPVKATYFAKMQQKEQTRPLLDNYKGLNPKFEVEYVDPDKEPTRAKQAGIRKYGTLVLAVGNRENKLEDVTEEKMTNSLIKLLKDKTPTLCVTTGHGEKNFNGQDAEGYESVKKSLADQSYEIKELNLLQEAKVSESCDALAIIGPTKSFFAPEAKAIRTFFENGGRGLIALDINLKGGEYSPELIPVLSDWHIKPETALIVDPLSRMLGADASVAILATFSKESPITKEFQGNCAFPFSRPLTVVSGAPAGLNVQWLAQSNPKSWAVTDLKQLEKGEVRFDASRDQPGPLNAAIVVDGKLKDSKATRNTRLVVFGSSFFATNNYSRFAGNLDFFMNSVSWVMEDESLISIRAKEEGPGKIELSQKAGTFIFLLTVILIPLAVAMGGLAFWVIRRKL